MTVVVHHPHVSVSTDGTAFVRGSRVPVLRLWKWYKNSTLIERICKRYPQINRAQILDALSFALDNEELMEALQKREENLLVDAGRHV